MKKHNRYFYTIGAFDMDTPAAHDVLARTQKRHDRENRTILIGIVLFTCVVAILTH